MDLSKLKNKLSSLQEGNRKGSGEKKDYSLTTFTPPVGEVQIRIVPSKYYPKDTFKEVLFYYDIGRRMMLSPLNFNEKDPINLFVQQLEKEEYTKEKYYLIKKLQPKMRIFLPVIERGKEDLGVRLWQFGPKMYETLVKYALDDETKGFEDILNGRDFTIDTVSKENTGTGFSASTIRPRLSTTPLSKDKKLVELWLENQPDPLEEYKNLQLSFEDMKAALAKFLTPEEDEENIPEENPNEIQTSKQTLNKNEFKKKKSDKIDELFSDNELSDDADDLPF